MPRRGLGHLLAGREMHIAVAEIDRRAAKCAGALRIPPLVGTSNLVDDLRHPPLRMSAPKRSAGAVNSEAWRILKPHGTSLLYIVDTKITLISCWNRSFL